MDADTPILPLDLERVIFELAFHNNEPVLNRALLLVAKRTNEWIKPLFYSVIDQFTPDTPFPDYKKYPNAHKYEEIGVFVKHLIFNGRTHFESTEELRSLLECCPNIINLACWGGEPHFLEILGAVSNFKNLRRLSVCLNNIPKEAFDIPLFSSITRLDVRMPWASFPFEVLSCFKSLKQLRIFGGDTAMDIEMIMSVVIICPWLELYIIPDSDIEYISREIYEWCEEEPRFIICDKDNCGAVDWLQGARGEPNLWDFLAKVVFARKSGFLIPGEYRYHRYMPDFDWIKHLTEEGKVWYKSTTHPTL